MKCGTLECFSEAVARSRISNTYYCVECACKVVRQHGPNELVSLHNVESRLPWGDYDDVRVCAECGNKYTKRLIGLTGDCPKCRKPLPEYAK